MKYIFQILVLILLAWRPWIRTLDPLLHYFKAHSMPLPIQEISVLGGIRTQHPQVRFSMNSKVCNLFIIFFPYRRGEGSQKDLLSESQLGKS